MPFNFIFTLHNNGKAIYVITLLFLSAFLFSCSKALQVLQSGHQVVTAAKVVEPGLKMLSRYL